MKKCNFLFKSLVLLAFFGLFVISGCKKDNNNNSTSTTTTYPVSSDQSTQASSDADDISNNIENLTGQVVNGIGVTTSKSIEGKKMWYCANIITDDTITSSNGTYRKIVIDFDGTDSTCVGFNNVPYSGEITIEWHGGYYKAGFWDSVKFNNFTIHKREINGYHFVTNIKSTPLDYQWDVNVNYTLTRPNGTVFTWTSNRLRELTTDSVKNGTLWDAIVYKIYDQTGKVSTLTNTKNDSIYTFEIASPLILHADCYYIESGIINEYVNGSSTVRASINFGTDGVCDNKATLTYKGKNYTIYM